MWKKFVGCLCIFSTVKYCGADQEKLTFCDIGELFFNQKCPESLAEVTIDKIRDKEFIVNFLIWSEDDERVEMINEFVGLLKPKKSEEVDSCMKEAELNRIIRNTQRYFTIRLFQVCELHVYSLVINTNKTTELAHLYTEVSKVPNITELTWKMHNKCHPVNEIISNLKHLTKLELELNSFVDLNECDFGLDGVTQLNILFITLKRIRAFALPTYLGDMMNLTELKLNCIPRNLEIDIPSKMLQGLGNLKKLTLSGCFINELSTQHFQNLENLRVLHLMDATIENFDWLRSETLAKHVSELYLPSVDMKYLENYTNLDTVVGLKKVQLKRLVGRNYFVSYICFSLYCEFYKDQPKIYCPDNCDCIYDSRDMHLELNCKFSVTVILFKILFNQNGVAEFYLNNTNLSKLPDFGFYNYSGVYKLNLANNQLDDLTVSQLPHNLSFLDLRNNSLKTLKSEVIEFLKHRNSSLRIQLSNNPWSCDCHRRDFLNFLVNFPKMIDDFESIECDGLKPSLRLDECRILKTHLILAIAVLLVIVCVVVCGIIFWFKMSILMWLYDHDIFVNCILRSADNIEFTKKFDAFLAYSHKNLDLIEEYVEHLENGQREFKLCFYHRDWLIGESIPECILQTIEDSKRIILLMTKEFIKSSWGTLEFRTAIKATSIDRQKRLIVIVYPEVKNFDDLDTELQLYMKYNTYLPRDDSQFWRKLIYAMPHKKIRKSKRKTNVDHKTEI